MQKLRSDDAGACVDSLWWRAVQYLIGAATIAFLASAISSNADGFARSIRELGTASVVSASLLALASNVCAFRVWRTMLASVGVHQSQQLGPRVFYVTQLGKYVPGAVWPMVMQVSQGMKYGVGPAQIVLANVRTLAASLLTGLILSAGFLIVSGPSALDRYWWLLLAVPASIVLLHPKAADRWIGFALRKFGDQRTFQVFRTRALVAGMGWSLLLWLAMGTHTYVLFVSLGGQPTTRNVALCIGATSIAFCAGLLFVIAPAGAGVRELTLALTLSVGLEHGSVLALLVVTRAIQLGVDLALALLAALAGVGRMVGSSERR